MLRTALAVFPRGLRARPRLGVVVLGALFTAGLLAAPACGGDTSGGAGGTTATGGTGGTGGDPGFCGDGLVDDLEECDDGNGDDADECTTHCRAARCGDGFVQPGEECDDANFDDTDGCVAGCVAAKCGDGFIQVGIEECDDGNQEDGDACLSTCTSGAGCGNGVVESGEDCDDGNASNADACLNVCVNAKCGDGYAQVGIEECDDGNTDGTDFCGNDCKLNMPMSYGCPGIGLTVSLAADTTVTGDTAVATDSTAGACGGEGAAEIVYRVTALDTGVLTITMVGFNGGDPVLYARAANCAAGSDLGCSDVTFAGGTEVLTFPVTAGAEYFVFADAYSATTAEFSLNLHLSTTVPGDLCPGVPVTIAMNSDVTLAGNTAVAAANANGIGACAPIASTKEVVYGVTPAENGTLTVTLNPAYDGQLYVRDGTCTKPTNQISCSEVAGVGGVESVSFPVDKTHKYSVFVDGHNGSAGSYTLYLQLVP